MEGREGDVESVEEGEKDVGGGVNAVRSVD